MTSRVERNNNFIISKGFRSYFRTLIISLVAEQVCLTFNMIFAGQFVSPEAFSALDLAIPVESFMTGLILLLVGGAAAPASRYVGDQQFDKAYKLLTSSLLLATGVSVFISVIALLNLDAVVRMLCSNDDLAFYLKDYLRVYFMLFIPLTASTALVQMINIDGKPAVGTVATVVACVLDVALDVLFLKGMNMGVEAVAVSDLIAYVLMIVIILPFLLSKSSQFKFLLARKELKALQKENLSAGVSYCIPNVVMCAIVFVVNNLVLNRLGVDTLYVWSVGYQIFSIVLMLMNCIGGTVLVTMGSMLVGCGEMKGFRFLADRSFIMGGAIVLIIVTAILIFPNLTLALFGGPATASADKIFSLRMVVLFAIPYSVCSLKSYLAQAMDNSKMAILPFAFFFFISLLFFFLSSVLYPYLMFLSLTVAGVVYLVADSIFSARMRVLHPDYSPYLLIPGNEGKHSFFVSVPYNSEGLESALADTAAFLQECNLSPSLLGGINICCEEMMMNLVEKNKHKGEGYFFDVFVLDDEGMIKVTIKDAGLPFNPVKKFEGTAAEALEAGEEMDLSLRLVNVLCQDLSYNYMFGQNTTYMSFKKD